LRAQLEFENNRVKALRFEVDTFKIQISSLFALTGRGIVINTGAAADEEVVRFESIGAELTVAGMTIGGEGRQFAFMGDGSFKTLPGFGVFLSVDAASGSGMGWPSFLPIKITQLGIEWRDIQKNPADFVLTLSASVSGLKAQSPKAKNELAMIHWSISGESNPASHAPT